MNSGSQKALEKRCCHIQVIFDRFRIVQHFNREIVDRAREDEQAQMIKERPSMPTSWRMRSGRGMKSAGSVNGDESGNVHLKRFDRMLDRHWEGIAAQGYYRISSGWVVNNLIKTVRRQGYGYEDDDYFFLKIMDASRRTNTSERESQEAMPA